jgi:hypothetical protein
LTFRQEWRTPQDDAELEAAKTEAEAKAAAATTTTTTEETVAEKKELPKYTKTVLKRGDGNKFPKKGDLVHIKYISVGSKFKGRRKGEGEGGRGKEEGGRRKEEGGRRKEEGGRRKALCDSISTMLGLRELYKVQVMCSKILPRRRSHSV